MVSILLQNWLVVFQKYGFMHSPFLNNSALYYLTAGHEKNISCMVTSLHLALFYNNLC